MYAVLYGLGLADLNLNPSPLGSSSPLLCPLFFGDEEVHDKKRRGYNFTTNNNVKGFKIQ